MLISERLKNQIATKKLKLFKLETKHRQNYPPKTTEFKMKKWKHKKDDKKKTQDT